MIGSAFGGPMDDVSYMGRATASGRWSSQFWSDQGWDEKRQENLTQVPIRVPSPSRSLFDSNHRYPISARGADGACIGS